MANRTENISTFPSGETFCFSFSATLEERGGENENDGTEVGGFSTKSLNPIIITQVEPLIQWDVVNQ